MTSKFFLMGSPRKIRQFGYASSLENGQGTEWLSLIFQSGGSVELSSSKKFHAHTTFSLCKKTLFDPWTPGMRKLL